MGKAKSFQQIVLEQIHNYFLKINLDLCLTHYTWKLIQSKSNIKHHINAEIIRFSEENTGEYLHYLEEGKGILDTETNNHKISLKF